MRVETGEPAPSELSLIVGDFVQNLRAALDHLVCSIVQATGSSPTASHAFPIFTTKPDASRRSWDRWNRQLKNVDASVVALIDYVQPYKRGAEADRDALACLQALSNEDKHRVVLQTVNAVVNPEEAPPRLNFEFHDVTEIEHYELHAMKPLHGGDVLMEAEIVITGPAPRISFKGELPIDVAFGQSMILTAEFATIFDHVDIIVAHLANEVLGAAIGPAPLGERLGADIFERASES